MSALRSMSGSQNGHPGWFSAGRGASLKTLSCVIGSILLASSVSYSIVIRHDVADAKYRISNTDFPALALLPLEGHGILISNQWVVTAAHAVEWRPVHEVTINGIPRTVAKVIVHPGYKPAPKELKRGDAAPLMMFMASVDDIALIKLDRSVDDVSPVQLYRGAGEVGQTAEMIGSGATGNGLVGQYRNSPHRGELRHAYSRVIRADDRWLGLRFDSPSDALGLEGMPADGDSGAPILLNVDGVGQLAGLASRKYARGELSRFRCCLYGQITYQVRISRYADWIDGIVGKN